MADRYMNLRISGGRVKKGSAASDRGRLVYITIEESNGILLAIFPDHYSVHTRERVSGVTRDSRLCTPQTNIERRDFVKVYGVTARLSS